MDIKQLFSMEYYNIGFINEPIGEILNRGKVPEIYWMKHKYKDRFFADPFLYKNLDDSYIIAAEEYMVYDRKGRIVLLTVDKKTYVLRKREMLLDEKTHLSFPYFHNGKFYPENYRSGAYYSYQLNCNYIKKELVANMPCIDPILFEDGCTTWLFTSFIENAMNQLYLYYREDGRWISHLKNPVVRDLKTARMAGKLFRENGNLYRPVQDCEKGYGNKTRIMRIIKLSKQEFEEEEVAVLDSGNYKEYNMGLHTFNKEKDVCIVDGYIKKVKVLRRILYAIRKRVLKNKILKEMQSNYNIK